MIRCRRSACIAPICSSCSRILSEMRSSTAAGIGVLGCMSRLNGMVTIGSLRSPTMESVLLPIIRRRSSDSSSVYIRMMNTQELGLGWRSAGELSTAITGGSGSNPNWEKDQPSASASRSEKSPPKVPYILIVEDNEADAFLIRRAIEGAGLDAKFHVIRDGEQAIRYIDLADGIDSVEVPDLVILDINLPKRPGGAVLRHMRNSHSCANALLGFIAFVFQNGCFCFTANGTCRTIERLDRRIGQRRDATRAPIQARNGWRPHGRRLGQPATPSKDGRIFVQTMGSTSSVSLRRRIFRFRLSSSRVTAISTCRYER